MVVTKVEARKTAKAVITATRQAAGRERLQVLTGVPRSRRRGLASGSARRNGDRGHSALLSLPPLWRSLAAQIACVYPYKYPFLH